MDIEGSSNGRTVDSDSAYLGSNPSPSANIDSRYIGAYGEQLFVAQALKRGYDVWRPVIERAKIDFLIERSAAKYERVQVKTSSLIQGRIQIGLDKYQINDFDALVIVEPQNAIVLWLPASVVQDRRIVTIRFAEHKYPRKDTSALWSNYTSW